MAKTRIYLVSFSPAEKTTAGFRTTFTVGVDVPTHNVEASSYLDLEREVRRLAREFGQSCCPYIRTLNSDRKPPGFDTFCATLRFIEAMPALIG